MAEAIQPYVDAQTRADRMGSVGLKLIAGTLFALGAANAVDEILDHRVASDAKVCVVSLDSEACDQQVQSEQRDSWIEGVGSLIGGGALGGLVLYMDYGIRHPKNERNKISTRT